MTDEQRATPSLLLALTPVVLTLLILGTQIFYFGVFEPHIPLAIGIALTSFVGTSGAGKSTIIDLILKFRSPNNGDVYIVLNMNIYINNIT